MNTFYKKHLFFCVNQRDAGKKCCNDSHATEMCAYAKTKLQQLGGQIGEGGVRINASGCLGRCSQGPCLVIYPEGIWYTYQNSEDIDLILQQHLLEGKVVDHLLIPSVN